MSASLALFRAKQAGVEVWVEGDKLRLKASSPVPSTVLELCTLYKSEVIELLRRQTPIKRTPDPNVCRFCGERISWKLDGTAFGDGSSAHNACYAKAVEAGPPWWE